MGRRDNRRGETRNTTVVNVILLRLTVVLVYRFARSRGIATLRAMNKPRSSPACSQTNGTDGEPAPGSCEVHPRLMWLAEVGLQLAEAALHLEPG